MKKTFLLPLLSASMIISTLAGCSKDGLTETVTPGAGVNTSAGKMFPADTQAGAVTGFLDPAKNNASILLIGDLRSYGPYYSDYPGGQFNIKGIPAGTYKLVVNNPDAGGTNDLQSTISLELIVTGNSTTDVGTIHL